jgi:hypothetical protein
MQLGVLAGLLAGVLLGVQLGVLPGVLLGLQLGLNPVPKPGSGMIVQKMPKFRLVLVLRARIFPCG